MSEFAQNSTNMTTTRAGCAGIFGVECVFFLGVVYERWKLKRVVSF